MVPTLEPHPSPLRSGQGSRFHRVTWNLERCQRTVIVCKQVISPEAYRPIEALFA
jgi:hypothetical protein